MVERHAFSLATWKLSLRECGKVEGTRQRSRLARSISAFARSRLTTPPGTYVGVMLLWPTNGRQRGLARDALQRSTASACFFGSALAVGLCVARSQAAVSTARGLKRRPRVLS